MKTVEVVNVQKDEEYTRVLFKGSGNNGLSITMVFEYDYEMKNPPEVGEKWALGLNSWPNSYSLEAKTISQQVAKLETYKILKDRGLAIPPDLEEEFGED